MTAKHGDKAKVVSSFKIDERLLNEAKDLAWELRISYSLKVEELVRAWVNKEQKKKKS